MELNITLKDDPVFVRLVANILDSVVAECAPEVIATVQIDNWFDHKWLNFSGKVLGALGVWKNELIIPPFKPTRVIRQTVYRLGPGGKYKEFAAPPLHIAQPSSENLNRKLSHATDSGIFAWWSSNTIANGKGSLMVYTQSGAQSSSWYVSFSRDQNWKINKTEDISVGIIERFMGPNRLQTC